MLDPRQGLADARDLGARLPAAADDPERRRALAGEELRRNAARRSGAQLPELVGLDHARDLGLLGVEEDDDEGRPLLEPRVRLQPGEPELVVDRGHQREQPALDLGAPARQVLDLSGRQPAKGAFDGLERVGGRQQLGDLGLGQVERHGSRGYFFGMKLIAPLGSKTAHWIVIERRDLLAARLLGELLVRDPLAPQVALDHLAVLDEHDRVAVRGSCAPSGTCTTSTRRSTAARRSSRPRSQHP